MSPSVSNPAWTDAHYESKVARLDGNTLVATICHSPEEERAFMSGNNSVAEGNRVTAAAVAGSNPASPAITTGFLWQTEWELQRNKYPTMDASDLECLVAWNCLQKIKRFEIDRASELLKNVNWFEAMKATHTDIHECPRCKGNGLLPFGRYGEGRSCPDCRGTGGISHLP